MASKVRRLGGVAFGMAVGSAIVAAAAVAQGSPGSAARSRRTWSARSPGGDEVDPGHDLGGVRNTTGDSELVEGGQLSALQIPPTRP